MFAGVAQPIDLTRISGTRLSQRLEPIGVPRSRGVWFGESLKLGFSEACLRVARLE